MPFIVDEGDRKVDRSYLRPGFVLFLEPELLIQKGVECSVAPEVRTRRSHPFLFICTYKDHLTAIPLSSKNPSGNRTRVKIRWFNADTGEEIVDYSYVAKPYQFWSGKAPLFWLARTYTTNGPDPRIGEVEAQSLTTVRASLLNVILLEKFYFPSNGSS